MKVQELRDLLKTADRELLEKAFVESYKQFTKGKKEEVDQIITGIFEGKDEKPVSKNNAMSFEELERQIPEFLENAYAQNYLAPNRVIPKSQRSKWRFMVKNYIKELGKIPEDSENYFKSVKMLTDLYHLLCTACNYYLFSSDDPFRSIGWEQPDLFHMVVVKTFGKGYSREKISALLLDAATGGLSRESLHIFQEQVLLAELKTSDVKYMAIEEARKLIDEKEIKLNGLKKYDNHRYDLKETVNNLCDMILMTAIELAEAPSEIEYYFQNYGENDKEITLYCALRIADWAENDELWIQIYEYGIGKKIKPRECLIEKYNDLKKR